MLGGTIMFNNGNDNGMYMPVAPAYGGGYGNNDGFFGGDFGGFILGLLFGGLGGWGGFGGFGGGWGNAMGFDYGMMPYFYNNQTQNDVNRGFADASISSAIGDLSNAVTSGFGDVNLGIAGVNQNICQTGSGIVSAVNGAQTAIAAQMYNNEIANLNRSFAEQTANVQGFNNVQSQLAQCCCDNRLATCQTQNIVQNEANSTRFADANNTRDIITNATANTQAILDKLCQLELDGFKRENDQLRSQLQFANLQASQVAQTAELRTNNATVANQLVAELRSCPIPSQPVYGNQPIFTCSGTTNGFGCGCGN